MKNYNDYMIELLLEKQRKINDENEIINFCFKLIEENGRLKEIEKKFDMFLNESLSLTTNRMGSIIEGLIKKEGL